MDELGQQYTVVFAINVTDPATECVCREGLGIATHYSSSPLPVICKDDSALFSRFLCAWCKAVGHEDDVIGFIVDRNGAEPVHCRLDVVFVDSLLPRLKVWIQTLWLYLDYNYSKFCFSRNSRLNGALRYTKKNKNPRWVHTLHCKYEKTTQSHSALSQHTCNPLSVNMQKFRERWVVVNSWADFCLKNWRILFSVPLATDPTLKPLVYKYTLNKDDNMALFILLFNPLAEPTYGYTVFTCCRLSLQTIVKMLNFCRHLLMSSCDSILYTEH